MSELKIPLTSIFTDPSIMVRVELDQDVITDYADAYARGDKLPPIKVLKEGDKYLVIDGWHRFEAAKRADYKRIEAIVIKGNREKALELALASNTTHGLRRTNADKRLCVQKAIAAWPILSDRRIAELCGVDHKTVAAIKSGPSVATSGEFPHGAKLAEPETPTKPHISTKTEWPEDDPPHITQPTASGEWPDIVVAKPGEPTDETGFPLTDTAKRSWAYREMVQGWLTTISRIKSEFQALEKEPLFIRYRQEIVAGLTAAYSKLTDVKPYAVCTECAGEPTKQGAKYCTYCGLSGVISKYAYDTQSRSSVKEVREKAAKRASV